MTDMEKKVMMWLCAKIVAETKDWEVIGMIRNVEHGGYYVLGFIVVNGVYKWYNWKRKSVFDYNEFCDSLRRYCCIYGETGWKKSARVRDGMRSLKS